MILILFECLNCIITIPFLLFVQRIFAYLTERERERERTEKMILNVINI